MEPADIDPSCVVFQPPGSPRRFGRPVSAASQNFSFLRHKRARRADGVFVRLQGTARREGGVALRTSFSCHLPHDLSVLFLSASLSCSPVLWALCWTQQEPPPSLLILPSLPPSLPRLLLFSVCPTHLPAPPPSSRCLLVSSCTLMRMEATEAGPCTIRTRVLYPPCLQPVTQTWTRPPCCHPKPGLCSSSLTPPTPA